MSRKENQDEATVSGNPPNSVDTATPEALGDQTSDETEYEYGCPYCDSSYQHELLTRVHVTRADDSDHLNRNGFMPETEIQILSEDGQVVNTVSRRPESIDSSVTTPHLFPDQLSDQHKHILTVAARNPHETTYSTLAEMVDQRLEDHDIDTPSYATIRRVIRRFFRPDETEEKQGDERSKAETLAALTSKQQAIVLARILSPEASKTEIADQIGCAKSYPTQVLSSADLVVSNMKKKLDQSDNPVEVITDELDDDDIYKLIERDLLENVPIDLEDAVIGSDKPTWGSPVKYQGGMTAAPNGFNRSCQTTDNSEQGTEQTRLTETENRKTTSEMDTSEEVWNNQVTEENPDSTRETIPGSEIKELQEKIRFVRKTFDESDENGNEALVSLARHIEERCDDILRNASATE
ncbi:MAG: hypothetical protein ABEI86_13170 [Halobacteriaceae archaeon]